MAAWRRALVLLVLAPAASPCQTASPTAAIQGTVADPSGAFIAGARVTARQTSLNTIRGAETGANGQFFLRGLPAGSWTVHIDKPGFAPLDAKEFDVSVGEVAVRRFTLALAGSVERVEVSERADAVESTATSSSAALSSNRVEEAPARNRSYVSFVALAPGAVPSAAAGSQRSMTGIRNPLADSGFSFAGMRGRNNSMNIDGVDNRDETTGGSRVAIGIEMVQEFRVAGVAVEAEFGGAAGGMVNVVTRTGANLRHGDFTFFGQNEALNARRADVDPAFHPRFHRIQPGVSTSGPIRRDRTFFFFALEHERENAQEWSETPEAALAVIDRQLAGGAFPRFPVRSVRRGLFDTGERGTEASFKLNHQLSDQDTLAVRYAFSRGRVLNDVQGVENFQDQSAGGSSLTTDHSLVANWVRVLSPAVVNEVRAQAARRTQEIRPNSSGPLMEIPGVVSLGQSYRLNADRTEDHAEAVENLHFGRGRHQMTAGADIHQVWLKARLANRFGGIYIFPTLSDFQAGRPDVFLQAFGTPATRLSPLETGAWAEDRWEPVTGLTLEGGVRLDHETMPRGFPSSGLNAAPRAGVAWKPFAKRPVVLRAGAGLFFDRFPLAYWNEAVQKNGAGAFEQYVAGDGARQALILSQGGSLDAPLAGIARSIYRPASSFPSTYSRKVSFGGEAGWGKDTTITVEAKSVDGRRLPRIRNVNAGLPPLYELEQTARSEYRGVSVSLNRRPARNMTYLLAYDLGRARDDASDFDEQPNSPRNLAADWGKSRQYQLHRFAASGVFETPDEWTAALPAWARACLEELSAAPILTAGSGRPINALLTSDVWRTGAYPLTARPPGMPRNPFLAPGTVSVDLRLMKTFPVKNGRAVLQFGAEAFNLLNHFMPGKASEFFLSPEGQPGTYGRSLEPGNGRQIQLMVQFEY